MEDSIINVPLLAKRAQQYAPLVLRISMAVVFLYFGIAQLRHPEGFIGWLPKEVELLPISPRTFVVLNGGFETFFGTMLLLGLYARLSAFLLGAHLFGIAMSIGWTEIGVRDFGLALATLVIVLLGAGPLNLSAIFDPPGSEVDPAEEIRRGISSPTSNPPPPTV